MDINKKPLNNAEEYTDFVREYVTLLDQQLVRFEEESKDPQKLHDLARSMPALVSLVNTVGYLRGQDGMFLDLRPRTDNQGEFYGYEDLFEKRLEKIIDTLCNSDEKDFYIERMESYLVKARSQQKPTIM